jgi:hypothetical protein
MKSPGQIIRALAVAAVLLMLSLPLLAANDVSGSLSNLTPSVSSTTLPIPPVRARMSPELALQVHNARTQRQARELAAYSDTTVVEAELPKTAQKGRYQVQRMFSAPRSLAFKAVNFVGDGVVKTNVNARMLQSEVDRAQKGDNADVAITNANYKFSYKGVREVEGGPLCHVFQVKPRGKRVGLFKGYVYLDAYTGGMRRAEGKMVKSPSFFVKNIEFSQDYTDVAGFDMVTHIRSTAQTRIVGKAIVDITHSDLQASSIYEMQTASPDQQPATVRPVSFENQH